MPVFRKLIKRLGIAAVLSGAGGVLMLEYVPKFNENRRTKALLARPMPSDEDIKRFNAPLPTRQEILKRMKSGQVFDVVVIGGGATGAGVALDAASRGLSTCLLEKYDFASGTSSRSTKLLHGGVRYLQKAIFNFDIEQFRMVNEALTERANLIDIAPHLSYPLPIMLPVYKWWQLPYFWVGIKMYDVISGSQILKASYYLSKPQVLERFPLLKRDKLVGGLVYYDGQHEDARMCMSIAMTAIRYDAVVANYAEAIELIKGGTAEGAGKRFASKLGGEEKGSMISGVKVRDRMTGEEFVIPTRSVVNATGPYTDRIRKLDDQKRDPICQPSLGAHIVLPGYYSPSKMGLLDPSTRDGRVIFFLPWLNFTLAGTTDTPCRDECPAPTESDVSFILEEIRDYLSPDIKVRRGDVLSAWAGIRPLVRDPNSPNTQSVARNHIIEVSPNGLVTIAGGKWTTYRSMAEETVDKLVDVFGLQTKSPCRTKGLLLEGAHGWNENLFIQLVQDRGLDVEVARHLTTVYGDKAMLIAGMASLTGKRWPILGKKLHHDFPFIEAEVKWACQEYALHAVDFVARRTRLAFLNVVAAQEALPRIVELMAVELNWSSQRQAEELKMAKAFLKAEMGLELHGHESIPINLSIEEAGNLVERFRSIDRECKGYITLTDLRRLCQDSKHECTDDTLVSLLSSMDLNQNGQVDLSEYLHFMSALWSGNIASTPFKEVLNRVPISVDRSGGGV